MVFSSLKFVFIFMPIFFTIYYLCPNKKKNIILLIGSLVFYFVGAFEHPEHFILLLLSIILDFYIGLIIYNSKKYRKFFLSLGIFFHIASLFLFKYAGFIFGEINRITNSNLMTDFFLPVGISFYTFQGISYIVDVYRGKFKAEQSLLRFAVYISMFEQLIAGPIVTYDNVGSRLKRKTVTKNDFIVGIETFIFGLGLKVLLANPLSKLFTSVGATGYESISTVLAWMAITAFTFHIYFDFFGYSLMAIGLGRMMGFNIPKNFDFPYISRSMTEFWRRWHITLGNWFKEYVYIPLGGNRNGTIATMRNLLLVWLLTGIWHGAGYNFLLWGAFLAFVIIIEKLFLGKFLENHKIISHIYMILLIPLMWAIFSIEDFDSLKLFLGRLFPLSIESFKGPFPLDFLTPLKDYWYFFIIGFILSTKKPFELFKRINNQYVIMTISAVIFVGSAYCMYKGFDDPFLYFRF